MTRTAWTLLTTVSLLACGERQLPVQPSVPGPAFQIQDAEHSSGNQHFFFLPPLVPRSQFTGVFDPNESPLIIVCRWTGTACGTIAGQFSMTSGTGSQVVRVDLAGQAYGVSWDSNHCIGGPCGFAPGDVLRLRVLVAGTELGHADVQLVGNAQQAKSVNNAEFVPLAIGKTLTIKFRIEQGAVFVVGPSGGTITAIGGHVTLVLPSGALSGNIGITVMPSATLPNARHLVPGTAFDFGPSGTTFAQAVQLTIKYDPTHLPASVRETALRLHKAVGDIWQPVVGSTVNTSTTSVTGAISSFSSYAAVAFTWSSISAGGHHTFPTTCGLSGGVAYCWGNNLWGQLGVGSIGGDQPLPSIVDNGNEMFQSLSVGRDSTFVCGQAVNPQSGPTQGTNVGYCWGFNGAGQLGNGSTGLSPMPVRISGWFFDYLFAVGYINSCAVVGDWVIPCWGAGYGLRPVNNSAYGPEWQTLSAGLRHTCGVATEGTYCWGTNGYGQLGDGSTNLSGVPAAVIGSFDSVSAGGFHTCGLSGGVAYCWGNNSSGELGHGSNVGPESCIPVGDNCSRIPVAVAGGLTFKSVSAGLGYTCGVSDVGDAWCWGDDSFGQLGTQPAASSSTPVQVVGGLKFGQLSTGPDHACGVTDLGDAYCWGDNQHGQLGDGSKTNSPVPVEVKTP